ncbi:hypothetical protein ACS0TY_033278 [Phlomoides rotata]
MIESERMCYVWNNQGTLRTDEWCDLKNAADRVQFLEEKGLRSEDRLDIHVFKMKLDRLIKDFKDKKIFGKVDAKFQKRGLPHAHILLFLSCENKIPNPDDVDRIIFTEIPNKDTHSKLHDLASNYMINGPCGVLNYRSACMEKNRCA